MLEFVRTDDHESALEVKLAYHDGDGGKKLLFSSEKQKIFQLSGEEGLDLINPIEEQIRSQASEFRDLPNLPNTEGEMAGRALLVSTDAELSADSLRKADAVTLRRSGFALLLGDVQAHSQFVEANSWRDVRYNFYGLIERHFFLPETFFSLSRYLPRIFAIALQCGDYEIAIRLLERVEQFFEALLRCCETKFQYFPSRIREFRMNFGRIFAERLFQFPASEISRRRDLLKRIREVFLLPLSAPYSLNSIKGNSRELLLADWGTTSYANHWINQTADFSDGTPTGGKRTEPIYSSLSAIKIFEEEAKLHRPYWLPLVFPTRPIKLSLISTQAPSLIFDYPKFATVVRGLRGNWMPNDLTIVAPIEIGNNNTLSHIRLSDGNAKFGKNPRIALTGLEVTDDQWEASVAGAPDLSFDRFRKLHQLLNLVSKTDPKPDYVLLPECSVPRKWALPITQKLAGREISLIAGLEYGRNTFRGCELHNDALISLRSDYLGYRSDFVILQSKQAPAWGEAEFLRDKHCRLVKSNSSLRKPVVFVHEEFCIGVLVCSDLTDIEMRYRFQGKVDLLLVPEWNRDIETFSSLIESAAHDIHAFVAQANNRLYGDSRLRAPMAERYQRDIVRMTGGENDHVVVATIDFWSLRKFQTRIFSSTDRKEIFKPVPIGFEKRLSKFRKYRWC